MGLNSTPYAWRLLRLVCVVVVLGGCFGGGGGGYLPDGGAGEDAGDDADGGSDVPDFQYGQTRDVTVAADQAHEIADPITGGTFVFPDGGHGVLQVREVIGGPAVTQSSQARRFFVAYSGDEQVRLRLPVDDGSELGLVGYGKPVGSVEGAARDGWWYVPSTGITEGLEEFDLPVPKSDVTTQGLVTQALLAPPNPGYGHYGVFPISPTEAKHAAIRQRVATAIDAYIAQLADSEQATARARVDEMAYKVYFEPAGGEASYTGFMRFDRLIDLGITVRRCFLTLPLDVKDQSIYHEVGHLMAHALVGDAVYDTLEAQAQGANHGLGEANAARVVGEEYAYYSQFMLGGSVHDIDVSSSDGISSTPPAEKDFTAIEGFGAVMLASLTRTATEVKSAASRRSEPAPVIGASHADVLRVIAGGATALPALRSQAENMAAISYSAGNKLPAMLERIGWSYHGKARLVDPDMEPIVDVTVDVLSIVDKDEYGMQPTDQATSDDDGVVVLPRVFPGTSVLRVKTSDGRQADVAINPGWEEPTNQELDFGDVVVDLTLYCYARVKLANYKHGSPESGWSTCTVTGDCPLYQGDVYDLFAGSIADDAYYADRMQCPEPPTYCRWGEGGAPDYDNHMSFDVLDGGAAIENVDIMMSQPGGMEFYQIAAELPRVSQSADGTVVYRVEGSAACDSGTYPSAYFDLVCDAASYFEVTCRPRP